MEEIDPETLRTRLDGTDGDPDVRLVDVRPPGAFEREHIPGSENVPLSRLADRIEEFDDTGEVVTVCLEGVASLHAARLLASYEGVEGPVRSLAGGVEAWDGDVAGGRDDGTDDGSESGAGDAPF